jgi:hypothetical protein
MSEVPSLDKKHLPPGYLIRQAAVAAESTYPTVRKVLLGLPTKPVVRARIERVLRELGLLPPTAKPPRHT